MLPLQRQPESICIMRLSALGDATHVVPVVRALQRHWPETRISWIIGKPEHVLLGSVEGVEFIVFDKKGGWASVRKLRQALRRRRFDVLLQMQVSTRSNLLSRLVRAPVRLGWDKARSREFHHLFVRERVAAVPMQHQVPGFLEFARALGVPVDAPTWDLPIADEARAWVAEKLPAGQPVLMISPCSSHPMRNWRSEYYALAADYAAKEHGMKVVLCGGPSRIEKRVAAEIDASMQAPSLNLVGQDTPEQFKALLDRADLLLTPDSGPAHVASALGTPVIGLHAATWSRRSGPFNSLPLCVDRFEEAAKTFRKKNAEELRWGSRIELPGVMDLVEPEAVFERILQARS